MRHGLSVPIFGEYGDARVLADLAVEAEAAGWDGFWIWDHIQWSGEDDGEPREPTVDTTVALSLIAAATSRVRFGPMVMPLPRRRPWKVARELTSLDHLSGGRLTVGVGIGGLPGLEFGDFGEDTDAAVRAAKLDESLEVLAGLWTGEPFDYSGRHYRLTRAEMLPVPVQRPVPLWVGGSWPDAMAPFRRAARHDGVHPLLFSVPEAERPRAVREMVAYVAAQRTEPGRPFDVAYGEPTAGDGGRGDADLLAEYEAAGVTWWMEPLVRSRAPLAELRERIRRGPPTSGRT